jgi:hypothetical protein
MENVCIRFAGIDENSGALFLQFALPENISTIDQSTIHAFFPHHYETKIIEELIPHMAAFGHSILGQQQLNQPAHRFSEQQLAEYSKLIGTSRSVEINQEALSVKQGPASQYNPDGSSNPNSHVDEFRNIVLEILAEEGLIAGSVK